MAFALQRVITAIAGYFVILRGKTFNVGDRIQMGGARGDVIGLSFMQTRIMEMGQSPMEQSDPPSMWVHSRQFTGRIVTVTNDKVFDCPVYNYTHEFPYIWDEIRLPLHFNQDFGRAEQILLEAGRKHALTEAGVGEAEVKRLEERFGVKVGEIDPRVYWRITENWVELTLRFLAPDHGIRSIKDRMTRDILGGFDEATIAIAAVRQEAVKARTPAGRDGAGLACLRLAQLGGGALEAVGHAFEHARAFAAVDCAGEAAAPFGLRVQRLALLLGHIDQHVDRAGELAVSVEQRSWIRPERDSRAVGPQSDCDRVADRPLLPDACAIGHSSCGMNSPVVV